MPIITATVFLLGGLIGTAIGWHFGVLLTHKEYAELPTVLQKIEKLDSHEIDLSAQIRIVAERLNRAYSLL